MNTIVQSKLFVIKSNLIIKEILSNKNKIITKYGIFFFDIDKKNIFFQYAVLIKKQVGNAVKRNYCKRIVREFLRKNMNIFKKSNRIVFLYNYKNNITYQDIEKEFLHKINNA